MTTEHNPAPASPIPPVSYVLWPSLYARDYPAPVTESWGDFVRRFSGHVAYASKDHAPGFGPYALTAPDAPRRDSSVAAMTLAVFDVDHHATHDSLAATDAALEAAGVARLWYSSWSWPSSVSFRLVLPLDRPAAPWEWPSLRDGLIRAFGIDADPAKCSGLSHFYFGPSCPAASLQDAVIDVGAGGPVPVSRYVSPGARPRARRTGGLVPLPDPTDYQDDPDDALGENEVRKALEVVRKRWAGARNADLRRKAELLGRLLAGEVLAEDGDRKETTFRLAGVVAHAVPDAATYALVELFTPSLDAMIDAGSAMTIGYVERAVVTALSTARARKARDAAIGESFGRWSATATAGAGRLVRRR